MITGGKYIYIFISKIYIFASSYCIMNRSDNNGRERLDMEYESLFLENLLTVQKLYSVHYFEYMKDFVFAGESHDFWEFVCVDKGEVNIITDKSEFLLKKVNSSSTSRMNFMVSNPTVASRPIWS